MASSLKNMAHNVSAGLHRDAESRRILTGAAWRKPAVRQNPLRGSCLTPYMHCINPPTLIQVILELNDKDNETILGLAKVLKNQAEKS
jgi:hypothetical protein